MRPYPRLFALASLVTTAAACNMVKFTANTTSNVLRNATPALQQESDVELARQAAPASLKTVEGFLMASPENENLISILAEGYCGYAYGFLQNDFETFEMAGEVESAAPIGKRATGLFLRCMNYGFKLLGDDWQKALYSDMRKFEAKVKDADEDDVPGMFWVGLGLANAINLNRDDIDMVAFLPKAKMIMERIVKLDEKFFNAGAHMTLGMMYTAQAHAMGGNPEKGKEHFERAITLTDGKYLMPIVLMALNYGVITSDQNFFHSKLVQVLATSPAVWPDQRLANELAHIRARRYLAHEKEWF